MRSARRTGALLAAALALGAHPAAAADPLSNAPCSVFDPGPCTPSFCGVYGPWPCVPELPSVGQDLRLTVHSRDAKAGRPPEGTVGSIRELFAALRACWEPPPAGEALRGMQMSVRFSFKRTGEPVAAPRVTYASGEADPEMRQRYRRAIDAAFERCTPMPFSRTMGGAIAGRPIAIRFVDDRDLSRDDSNREDLAGQPD